MRNLKSAILFAATAVGSVTSAFAGAGILTTVVTPLSAPAVVTYSKSATASEPALVTWVGYMVTIANGGGNTINNIRFTGATSITDTAEKAAFSSAEGANCTTTNADQTAIDCSIGQLTAGASYPTFVVFFKAPVKVVQDPPVADVNGQDFVRFRGTTYYAEGTGGVTSPPQNSTTTWDTLDAVALGTDNPLVVKSALPKGGGFFFTGAGAVSNKDDRFTTSVNAPASGNYSTAKIEESSCGPGPNFFYVCWQSNLAIKASDGTATSFAPSYLTIVLRQDALNIRPGTKIGSIKIDYLPDWDGVTLPPPPSVDVGDCAGLTMPSDGVPCIAKRVYYKNSSVPGWTPALDGDFEWQILNRKNGTYKFPS